LARAWGNERFASFGSYPGLLLGVEHHDDGWRDWDATPRLNPTTGIPRSFMEMKMRDSTAIWTESITICSSEPLAGIAVSQHFCHLALQVKKSGRGDADDLEALDRFLQEQAVVIGTLIGTSFWKRHPEILASIEKMKEPRDSKSKNNGHDEHLGRDEAKTAISLRTVPFFDSVSLWLCCAERREPERMVAPTGESVTLIPRSADEIALDPYPLGVDSLQLTTPARRVPARKYIDEPDFQAAFTAAPVETLAWTIHPV
jgi:Protein of unknown function (DUF3891)